jgi:hypothetical protein
MIQELKKTHSKKHKENQQGYAILFAVVTIGIILAIAIGLSNATYKQLVLSSVASNSQVSFYESDTATECALYADLVANTFSSGASTYSCGVDKNGSPYTLSVTQTNSVSGTGVATEHDTAVPTSPWDTSLDPCFEISLDKTTSATPIVTVVKAKGYNTCLKTNLRTVEREIDATY